MTLRFLWPRTSSYVVSGQVCACTIAEKFLICRVLNIGRGPYLTAASAEAVIVTVSTEYAALPEPFQHVHVLANLLGRELHWSTIGGLCDEITIDDSSHDLLIDRVVGVKLADRVIQAVDSLVFNIHILIRIIRSFK